MHKACRALSSANLLLADKDVEGACNRAYYAMFNAAHAALLWTNAHANLVKTKTHSRLINAFGLYLVKPGHVPAEFGHSLNEVERVRRLADYIGGDLAFEKAALSVRQAQAFVQAVKAKFAPYFPTGEYTAPGERGRQLQQLQQLQKRAARADTAAACAYLTLYLMFLLKRRMKDSKN